MTPDERAARRAAIKAHHPDRGGDPARFVEVLAAIDGAAPAPAARTVGVPSRHPLRRLHLTVRLRARLPRRVPGARRYASY